MSPCTHPLAHTQTHSSAASRKFEHPCKIGRPFQGASVHTLLKVCVLLREVQERVVHFECSGTGRNQHACKAPQMARRVRLSCKGTTAHIDSIQAPTHWKACGTEPRWLRSDSDRGRAVRELLQEEECAGHAAAAQNCTPRATEKNEMQLRRTPQTHPEHTATPVHDCDHLH